jgi:energy-coupling factor transport system substrate-specific component
MWFSFLMLASVMLPLYIRFEKRAFTSREIVLLSVLAVIAAVSRVPFAPLPGVQPVSFVIIMTAIVFGKESGFMVGATAAIVSNFFLGQGPWTPWQMFAWGLVGFLAGLLKNTRLMNKAWGQMIFGFLAAFLFGWIMNVWMIVGFINEVSWESVIAANVASFAFDLAHALSNVFFIAIMGRQWIKILERFKRKYGLLRSY